MLRNITRKTLAELAATRTSVALPRRNMSTLRSLRMAGLAPKPIKQKATLPVAPLVNSQARSFSSYPRHTVLTMPSLSPTMEEGSIVSWEKKVGEKIEVGDPIAMIQTDKSAIAFDSTDEGYLAKIIMGADSGTIKVNVPIAIIVEEEGDVAAFANYTAEGQESSAPAAEAAPEKSTQAAPAPTAASTQATSSNGGRVLATPAAKAEATARGINLDQISGTGPNQRIIKADVAEFKGVAAPAAQAASTQVSASTPAASSDGDYTDVALTPMRKVIAQRLTQSKQSVPHYYVSVDVQMDAIMKLRSQLNKQLEAENAGVKLSVNDFIIKASAAALMKVPEVNSAWQDSSIRQYNYADISVAVATPTGLITPIIANAQDKGLSTISLNMKDLAKRARENKLSPNEYQGGTFTISNLGMFGVKHFTAIINPPQAAILAVGGTEQKVVVNPAYAKDPSQPQFKVANVMTVTASFDHRVVDGAVGAQWLAAFREFCEDPMKLLL